MILPTFSRQSDLSLDRWCS